jgi:hypothetical protein
MGMGGREGGIDEDPEQVSISLMVPVLPAENSPGGGWGMEHVDRKAGAVPDWQVGIQLEMIT